MNREQDRLSRLQRRLDHLDKRIAERKAMPSYARSQSRDIAEASALKWAIRKLEALEQASWFASVVYLHYHDRKDLDPVQQKHLEMAVRLREAFTDAPPSVINRPT